MNVPKAIELSLAQVLRAYANTGAKTVVRPWQTLSSEQAIAINGQKLFPMIEIRCGAPASDENQVTRYCDVLVLCASYNEDDKNHDVISKLFDAAQETCDLIHDQFMAGGGDAYEQFESGIADEVAGFGLGGVSYSESAPPYDDAGVNFMGVSLRVHFTK